MPSRPGADCCHKSLSAGIDHRPAPALKKPGGIILLSGAKTGNGGRRRAGEIRILRPPCPQNVHQRIGNGRVVLGVRAIFHIKAIKPGFVAAPNIDGAVPAVLLKQADLVAQEGGRRLSTNSTCRRRKPAQAEAGYFWRGLHPPAVGYQTQVNRRELLLLPHPKTTNCKLKPGILKTGKLLFSSFCFLH